MAAESTFVALNFSPEARKEFTGEEERTMKVWTQVLRSELYTYIERGAFGMWSLEKRRSLCVYSRHSRERLF